MDPGKWICAADLAGKDVVVEIEKVEGGEVEDAQNQRKSRKPICHFVGKKKPLALNVTNCKTIANLFGSNDVDDWVGKKITLYPTTTQNRGETVECVRVRPMAPGES